MKGIILAGGKATRLRPLTEVTSKQLLPVYDQPMIYYPIQTLVNAGIKDILIIVAPENAGDFLKLLGSGSKFGARFAFEVQDNPEGLAQAYMLGEEFIGDDPVALVLGDNIFTHDFTSSIKNFKSGGQVFAKQVSDPERFGVIEFDEQDHVISIEEKPAKPKSNYAQVGFYLYDNRVVNIAKNLKKSARGEYEIVDIANTYREMGELKVDIIEGHWMDAGTIESLYEASTIMRAHKLGLDMNKADLKVKINKLRAKRVSRKQVDKKA